LLFTMLTALLPMMTNEVRAAGFNLNYVTAQCAADAAAKIAVNIVQDLINGGTVPNTLESSNDLKLSDTSKATARYTYKPDNAANPTRIEITAAGTCGLTQASAAVNIYLKNSPIIIPGRGVLDLMNTASYSHADNNPNGATEVRWMIRTDKNERRYASPSGVSQVMFNDPASGDTIDIFYRASAARKDPIVTTGGGYGIYYGMIGNADNMNAYVLHYDPGSRYDISTGYEATKGTLLVKKVIFDSRSTNFTSIITDSPGDYEVNEYGYESGNDERYYAVPFETPYFNEKLRVPLYAVDNGQINGTSLETLMNNYYQSIGSSTTFDPETSHVIRIKTELDNGIMWHKIYCDEKPEPILKFYDHSIKKVVGPIRDVAAYKLQTFKGTCTGLRVWNDNVTVNFMNDADSSSTQTVSKSIVWVR
ncbi:MAG: hypothetical protein PVG90_12570, partial [Bacillota bacterium]